MEADIATPGHLGLRQHLGIILQIAAAA